MKISLTTTQSLLAVCFFSFISPIFAQQYGAKSFWVTVAVPVIGGVYSTSQGDWEGLKELGYSCAFTAHVTTLTKNTVRRTRPSGEDDLSFPSGHAAASFTGASFMHHRYGLKWGAPLYLIAAAISIQRVNVDDHYWTDVLAGAALGYISGYLFSAKYPNIWLEPDVDTQNKSYGMQLKMKW